MYVIIINVVCIIVLFFIGFIFNFLFWLLMMDDVWMLRGLKGVLVCFFYDDVNLVFIYVGFDIIVE